MVGVNVSLQTQARRTGVTMFRNSPEFDARIAECTRKQKIQKSLQSRHRFETNFSSGLAAIVAASFTFAATASRCYESRLLPAHLGRIKRPDQAADSGVASTPNVLDRTRGNYGRGLQVRRTGVTMFRKPPEFAASPGRASQSPDRLDPPGKLTRPRMRPQQV